MTTNVISGVVTHNNIKVSPRVTGYTTPGAWDLIVGRYGFTDSDGDHASDRTSWSLTGYDKANTTPIAGADGTLKQRIYFKATGTTDYVIGGYLDAAMTASLVISGTEATRSTGSTVTLSEENSSGLSGTVVIGDAATNDTWFIDVEIYYDLYDADVDSGSANIEGILVVEDDSDSALDMWKVIKTAEIVNIDQLIAQSSVDNVLEFYDRRTLIADLRAVGIYA